jgi:hypothetical protein
LAGHTLDFGLDRLQLRFGLPCIGFRLHRGHRTVGGPQKHQQGQNPGVEKRPSSLSDLR